MLPILPQAALLYRLNGDMNPLHASPDVARQAGVAQEMLSRLERGRCAEFGARKLLAIAAVLGMEVDFIETMVSGSLDDLRRERSSA